MKAGLFTYHFSDNYGALYQAYGLRQWLRGRGIDAEFVNYHPTYVEEGGPLDRPWKLSLWRKNATILYMKQAHLRRRIFGDRAQHARFEAFRSDVLGVTGPRLKRAQDLAPEMMQYDMLFCGSDQIWNPSIQRGLDPVYFLDIAGADHARKVSFAPSFGRTEIEPRYNEDVRRMALGLDGLSVREGSGVDILERAGVPRDRALVVPDPTILLGCFDELLGDSITPDDSVFCYALRTDEVIRDVAVETARLTGGALRAPRTTHQRWGDIGEGIVPGPVEWLQNLARARVVVSNSFHGVALSVVLNRPFIAVGLPGKRASLNARVQNLLEVAGLEHRAVTSDDPSRICDLVQTPIDWEATNARLAVVRSEAEAYLDAEIAAAQQPHNRETAG
ncbi:polysaccharide pyruvyl transferase family protein [Salipiger marinus]|uniref:Polysaccharide pyruvyl transferase n=1 Tax=Salipiger marinus TaxID=555512 RepID=A0A1G8QKQ3_9RHOB|nr:polysaccharide pyruvyl transferase family protein [Salipiger marinus]SDJ05364.1 Polysaccharide pyruvyl transferase [Salipiger marinus]